MDKIKNIQVAKIIETDKIVINKGIDDGIEEGMRFLVYQEGDEIIDPVTKKSLGTLENPKGTFKVIHLQEKMSILLCELKRPNKLMQNFAEFSNIDAERDLLKTIKVGDKVKKIN